LDRTRLNQQLYLLGLVTLTALIANGLSAAASLNEARITRVNNSVQLVDLMRTARQAAVNDIVDEGTTIRTGKDSRAELTFSNGTIVRLASNNAFNLRDGTRGLNLSEGAVLIQAPRNAAGATIHAAGIAAAIAGTTCMIEYHPGVCKFLVLEGTGRLYRPGHLGDSVLVGPGQLVIGNPNAAVSDPVNFDIARFVKSSRFFVGLPPLRSEKLIAAESQKQQREKSKKTLIDTNLVIFGGGTRVSLVGQGQAATQGRATAPTATTPPAPKTTSAPQ
jgi:ferric-dicitrate binding protein FerR (iron transport regulator)